MTSSSSQSGGMPVWMIIVVSMAIGALVALTVQPFWPHPLRDGIYTLALPSDGALVVKDYNDGKQNFYSVPPEAVNYLVDETKAWTVQVTARGLYRLVTVYVPTEDYLPRGNVTQPSSAPPSGTDGALLPPGE